MGNPFSTIRNILGRVNTWSQAQTFDGAVTFNSSATFAGAGQSYTDPQQYSTAATISAGATQTQAGATLLTEEINNVTTVATAGDGVRLPTAATGLKITVKNSGANILAIYPFDSDSIDALAVNLPVRLQPGSVAVFVAKSAVVWESNIDNTLTLNAPTTNTGQLVFEASDSAGNTVTRVTNASQAGARTYTIPDAGASASFVQTEGAQTINGIKTFGSAPVVPNITAHGISLATQGDPTAEVGAATLTIADMLTKIITVTHTAGATVALTTDIGSAIEAGVTFAVGDSLDFSIINLSAAALDTVTLTAGASGVTLVGHAVIQSQHSSSTQPASALFRLRKTALNAYTIYRIAG